MKIIFVFRYGNAKLFCLTANLRNKLGGWGNVYRWSNPFPYQTFEYKESDDRLATPRVHLNDNVSLMPRLIPLFPNFRLNISGIFVPIFFIW